MIRPARNTAFLPGTLKNLCCPPEKGEYTYFKRAGECPFARSGTIVKAAWAADMSMLAYARYGQSWMTDADLDENFGRAGLSYDKIGGAPGDWNAHGTQAVFASCDQFAILAFRGTEPGDPKDIAYDLDVTLAVERNHRQPGQDGILPCLVHRGFQAALNEVWDTVQAKVMQYRALHQGAEILFTGHSLGGALAVLAYSRLGDQGASLYTFGCPRVGDGTFRDRALSSQGKGSFRFVNWNDAVTHIPVASLLYVQTPAQRYRFDESGNLNLEDDTILGDAEALAAVVSTFPANFLTLDFAKVGAQPSVVDHSPARYCMRLWDCVP